ncbi:MAG: hypothetical protein LBF85_00415 [Tannerella sp.]|jgi:deoxyribodipyrimidine photolyase|nr:hypothetical protein [Tannerella sp.]
METVKRTLKYEFTADELRELSNQLANKNLELRQKEEAKKSVVAEFGSQITVCREQINSLSDKVAGGYEYRDVSCTVEWHTPCRNQKTIVRSDTGASWTEPMNDADFTLFNQWERKEAEAETEAEDEAEDDSNFLP